MTDPRIGDVWKTAESILGTLEQYGTDDPIPPEGVHFLFQQLAICVQVLASAALTDNQV